MPLHWKTKKTISFFMKKNFTKRRKKYLWVKKNSIASSISVHKKRDKQNPERYKSVNKSLERHERNWFYIELREFTINY